MVEDHGSNREWREPPSVRLGHDLNMYRQDMQQ